MYVVSDFQFDFIYELCVACVEVELLLALKMIRAGKI
jgi:hypothetical protein